MNNLDFTQGKTNEGMLYGLHLGYEHIFAQNPPNRSFKDIIQNFDNINRYKVTADYRFGPTTYSQRWRLKSSSRAGLHPADAGSPRGRWLWAL